jgi:tetratricopeptide (TPR) repeat protein
VDFSRSTAYAAAMPEKQASQVPRALRELYDKGVTALQRNNLDYAIAIFMQVLAQEPGYFDAREALRATQFKKSGGKGGFFKKIVGTASSSPMIAKAQMTLRSNPLEAIATIEQVLAGDPNNASAHRVLAEAALAADLPKTAILSLEIILKNSPRDRETTLLLADALAQAGNVPKAEALLADLLRARPTDAGVAQALKNLSARRTLDEGGYQALSDGTGSYRDILRDKEQAVALEQEKREVKAEDVSGKLLADLERRIAADPKNLKNLRSAAELFLQRKEYDKALEYYHRIIATEGAADPSVEKAITETTLKKFDQDLERLDPGVPDHADQAARIRAARAEFLLHDTKRRAEKYPTDLQIRFELGQLYLEAGRVSEAIQELQKAQANPHRRLAAMGLLAQCFAKRGMNDLAARKLQEAIKEKTGFDDEKKELIYALGAVLEAMGKPDEAIEQFKQIYEHDIGYKDVAARVDAYYAGKG